MHEEAEAAVLAALREEEMRPMIIEEPKEDENKQVEQPRRGRAEILRKLLCGLLTRTRSEQWINSKICYCALSQAEIYMIMSIGEQVHPRETGRFSIQALMAGRARILAACTNTLKIKCKRNQEKTAARLKIKWYLGIVLEISGELFL